MILFLSDILSLYILIQFHTRRLLCNRQDKARHNFCTVLIFRIRFLHNRRVLHVYIFQKYFCMICLKADLFFHAGVIFSSRVFCRSMKSDKQFPQIREHLILRDLRRISEYPFLLLRLLFLEEDSFPCQKKLCRFLQLVYL